MKSPQISASRNKAVDAIRGIAMLLVVLGHTISVSTTGYEKTFVFQVIWTLQMPLFMMISGYVTRYSRPISTIKSLGNYIKKRSLAYLLPLVIWSIGVRGILLGQTSFLNIKYLLWQMDAGYWFLASLWTICTFYGLVDYLCNKLGSWVTSKTGSITTHIAGCLCSMVILGGIGLAMGINFFCIKLTLYYFPFYLVGYIYGQVQNDFSTKDWASKIQNICTALCLALWIFLITRIDFYSGEDSVCFIALRFSASLLGCIAIISLLSELYRNGGGILYQAGKHSIQIYLVHYLFLNMIRLNHIPKLLSVQGVGMVTLNYVLTLGVVVLVIILLSHNQYLSKILFFKDASQLYLN